MSSRDCFFLVFLFIFSLGHRFCDNLEVKYCNRFSESWLVESKFVMQVLRAEPYLELSSGQSAHCYQLFVEKDPKIEIPTVQVLRSCCGGSGFNI
jgi:hypothetical protein